MQNPPTIQPFRCRRFLPIVCGVVAAAGAIAAIGFGPSLSLGSLFAAWLCSCLIPIVILKWVEDGRPIHAVKVGKWERGELLTFLAIVLLGALLRGLYITRFPFQLHNDEMSVGLQARLFLQEPAPYLFGFGWWSQPNLGFFLNSLFLKVTADPLLGLRLNSLFHGVLSLVGSYLLVRQLFGKKVALAALLLTVTSHFHLHFSRTGFQQMQATDVTIWALYCLVLARRSGSLALYGLGGVLVGLAVQTYTSALLVVLVPAIWVLVGNFRHGGARFEPISKKGIAAWLAMVSVTAAPYAISVLKDFTIASDRVRTWVYVFSSANAEHVSQYVGSSNIFRILLFQAWKTFSFFFGAHDSSVQYGFAHGLMAPILWPFLIWGTFLCIRNWRSPGPLLLLLWCVGTLTLGGILTVDPPFSPRLVGISPLVMTLPVIGLLDLAGRIKHRGPKWLRMTLTLLVPVILCVAAAWNIDKYFFDFASYEPIGIRDYAARILVDHPDTKRILLISEEQEDLQHESFQFLGPSLSDKQRIPGASDAALQGLSASMHSPCNLLFIGGSEDLKRFVRNDNACALSRCAPLDDSGRYRFVWCLFR